MRSPRYTPATAAHTDAAAIVANILDTPCQDTQMTPAAGNLQLVRAATLCLVNQERARDDELPLRPVVTLESVAQNNSERMVGEKYFAHVSPSGLTPLTRFKIAGYISERTTGYSIGENIAFGALYLATPQAIVSAWIASPEHLANILESNYRDTGIGVVPAPPVGLSEPQEGATYTQDFGVITEDATPRASRSVAPREPGSGPASTR
jgi:uncharacterized protein YkwD